MYKTLWLCLFSLTFVAAIAAQQPSDRVISEALKASPLEKNLEVLTDQIGGRVPGTPAMDKAVVWGVDAFRAAGADKVYTERFTIQSSWAEGATHLSIVAPEAFNIRAVSIAWAPALTARDRVPVVDVGQGTEKDFAAARDLAGALLLVHKDEMQKWDDLFAEYLSAPGIIDRAVKAKALAIAFQSTRPNDLLYRHDNSTNGEIDLMPMVIVAREDAGRMSRLLAAGQKLYASVSIPNRVGGPINAANVVAEIEGSDKPDEIVVLGAHLDSWDLGTGALDNGCNAALVIDALRAIKASGLQPRRTMRFILFSGEEQGMTGSNAYTHDHRMELDKVAGMVVIDGGIGKVTGFSLGGRRDVIDAVKPMAAPLEQFRASELTTDAEWGTDSFDFILQGVPTFTANQEEGNYLLNYHAMSDTLDKVDFSVLKRHVAEMAWLSFALADAPDRVGPRLTHAQIEKTLRETHLDDQLKTFGMWQEWTSGKRGRND